MESEDRVRYSYEDVPGPEECPVYGIKMTRTHSIIFYVRAKDEKEAWRLMDDYYDKHVCEIDEDIMDSDPVSYTTIWLHDKTNKEEQSQ